jgi:hypothetical protein
MKLDRAIEDVREAEVDLAKRLRIVGERHAVEHDLYHMGHSRADKCAEHLVKLQPFAERYGAASTAESAGASSSPGLMETLRQKTSELLGRSEVTGLMLLADLRKNYLVAQRAEISWIVLIQVAKAARDSELLAAAMKCHEETEMTAKWLRTKIKVACPQVLATS